MKELDVEQSLFERIAAEIQSADSPVGIDAKKTHILILNKLLELEEKMKEIANKLDEIDLAAKS